MSNVSERRVNPVRRAVGSTFMRGGEAQESKLFATVGKIIIVALIYYHAAELIDNWEALLVLLSWLIAPDIAKKLITMKFGRSQGFTEHTEHSERTTRTGQGDIVDGHVR